MFEKFTTRARLAMQSANASGQRSGHDYLATHHVLLGLLEQPDCLAVQILVRLEVDARKLRAELAALVRNLPMDAELGVEPHAPRAMRAVEEAIAEARRLGHEYVGTEHLLVGLLGVGEGVAARLLGNLRVTLADARREIPGVLQRLPPGFNRLAPH